MQTTPTSRSNSNPGTNRLCSGSTLLSIHALARARRSTRTGSIHFEDGLLTEV